MSTGWEVKEEEQCGVVQLMRLLSRCAQELNRENGYPGKSGDGSGTDVTNLRFMTSSL
jgi:hypothetical protein